MSLNSKRYFSRLTRIVLTLITLAAPAAAQVSAQPTPVGYGMTSGRFVATVAAALALIGVVIGALALLRPAGLFGAASGRLGAFVALTGGLIGTALGGYTAATASGIGTGGGLAGAIVSLVLGLIALTLGGLALARSRRTG